MREKILVIKLGALGDLLLCMKPFQDIRAAFPNAHIALLTTAPFAALAKTMPWFDEIITDPRAPLTNLGEWIKLGKILKNHDFTRVFDFQTKFRTEVLYRYLFFSSSKTKWHGLKFGEKPPMNMHRQQQVLMRLRADGINDSGDLNLDQMRGDIAQLNLPQKYAVFIAGCSPHLLHKRWPPEHYAALAQKFQTQGIETVLVGTKADAESVAAIRALAPFAIDVCGKTNLYELASLYRGAAYVVGNDTGPTFLAAMVGATTLTLMSYHTNPVLSGPIGKKCVYLKKENIADISVDEVLTALEKLEASHV